MTIENQDPFAKIYALTKQRKLARALRLIVDPETHQLRDSVRFDRNHAWYCAGDILYKQNNLSEAREAFKKALRAWPDDIDALTAIGNCYDESHRPKLAERYFRRALLVPTIKRNKEKRQSIMLNLGNSLFDQQRFVEACKCYRKLLGAPAEIGVRAKKNLAIAESHVLGPREQD